MQPRIITGTAKNLRLKVPASARPITDRIKQSIFDLIVDFIPNAKVLDIFAGSGSLGIEALSRGATSATFVEVNEEARDLLKENINKAGFSDQTTVSWLPAEKFITKEREKYDLIFLDPPFVEAREFPLRIVLKIMTPEALLIFRYPTVDKAKIEIPTSFEIVHTELYGESEVVFLRLSEKRLAIDAENNA